jgi:hypothetical protein
MTISSHRLIFVQIPATRVHCAIFVSVFKRHEVVYIFVLSAICDQLNPNVPEIIPPDGQLVCVDKNLNMFNFLHLVSRN